MVIAVEVIVNMEEAVIAVEAIVIMGEAVIAVKVIVIMGGVMVVDMILVTKYSQKSQDHTDMQPPTLSVRSQVKRFM
jgi:heme/copper-type cytochrome/quinol oxidase subunit 2